MKPQLSESELMMRSLLKSSLAAAGPALAALVVLISTSAPTRLADFGLGLWGMAALCAVLAALAYLYFRGRRWAGVPAILVYAGSALYFGLKFARPMIRYFEVNPFRGIQDLIDPFMMLSLQLTLMVISLGLGYLVLRGMRFIGKVGVRPVSLKAWGVLVLWLLVLGGDLLYQQVLWKSFKSPDDLVVRLCLQTERVRAEAADYLLAQPEAAVPALLKGAASEEPGLECLREGSLDLLAKLGPTASPALVRAAQNGSLTALRALERIGDPKAAPPLLELYRSPKGSLDESFHQQLVKTLRKLDPTLNLDG